MGGAPVPISSSAPTPIATVTSTVISPSVSKPRKSTRMTLTTLRPCASRGAASAKYADSRDVVPEAPMNNTSVVTRMPAAAATSASRVLISRDDRSPNPAQLVEHEDEDHDGQRFDGELGHREIGRAEQRVEQRHAVADRAQRQHGRHVRPRERRRYGRRDDQRREHAFVRLRWASSDSAWAGRGRPPGPCRPAPPTSATTMSTYERSDALCSAGATRRLTASSAASVRVYSRSVPKARGHARRRIRCRETNSPTDPASVNALSASVGVKPCQRPSVHRRWLPRHGCHRERQRASRASAGMTPIANPTTPSSRGPSQMRRRRFMRIGGCHRTAMERRRTRP